MIRLLFTGQNIMQQGGGAELIDLLKYSFPSLLAYAHFINVECRSNQKGAIDILET